MESGLPAVTVQTAETSSQEASPERDRAAVYLTPPTRRLLLGHQSGAS